MEFQTTAQQACYEKVTVWMQELFNKYPCARSDFPGLGMLMGSAIVEVLIYPWENDDAIINTRSYVVTGAQLDANLMHFLLRENVDMRFGAFGIDPQGDILFEHTIVGSSCDKNELKASVVAVSQVADEYDDQIVSQWGGKRALERVR